jgi:integrase
MTDKTKPEKIPLTEKVLDALRFENRVIGRKPDGSLITVPTPPHMKDWVVRDSTMPGFLVRVTSGGIRFYAQRKLGGRPCPVDLGSWSDPVNAMTLAQARKAAEKALAKMRLGHDPRLEKKKALAEVMAERERARLTVGAMLEQHRLAREKVDSQHTARDRLTVQKWIKGSAIWRTHVFDITASALDAMMRDIGEKRGGPSSTKVWRYVCAAFNRLPSAGCPPVNPFKEWLKIHTLPPSKRRQTTLATDDKQGREWLSAIAAVRESKGAYDFPRRVIADYVLMCAAWGARRGEASRLLETDVDFDKQFVVFRDTKNKNAHYFPLTPGCAAILKNRMEDNAKRRGPDEPLFMFPSRKRGIAIVEPKNILAIGKKAAGLKVDMHDLRRLFAGEVAVDAIVGDDGKVKSGGFGLVKLALNHASAGADVDVTQGYIMVRAKLKILRPLYAAQERRVLTAAGLTDLLPEEEADDIAGLIAALKKKSKDPAAMKKIRAALK